MKNQSKAIYCIIAIGIGMWIFIAYLNKHREKGETGSKDAKPISRDVVGRRSPAEWSYIDLNKDDPTRPVVQIALVVDHGNPRSGIAISYYLKNPPSHAFNLDLKDKESFLMPIARTIDDRDHPRIRPLLSGGRYVWAYAEKVKLSGDDDILLDQKEGGEFVAPILKDGVNKYLLELRLGEGLDDGPE